jgi:hypothetical protein
MSNITSIEKFKEDRDNKYVWENTYLYCTNCDHKGYTTYPVGMKFPCECSKCGKMEAFIDGFANYEANQKSALEDSKND